MKCPFCNNPKSRVQETRSVSNTIWRVRRCDQCDQTFPTKESLVDKLPVGVHRLAEGKGTRAPRVAFKSTLHLQDIFRKER